MFLTTNAEYFNLLLMLSQNPLLQVFRPCQTSCQSKPEQSCYLQSCIVPTRSSFAFVQTLLPSLFVLGGLGC